MDLDEEADINMPRVDFPKNRNEIDSNQTTSNSPFKLNFKQRSKSVGHINKDHRTPKVIYKYVFKNAENKLLIERGNQTEMLKKEIAV